MSRSAEPGGVKTKSLIQVPSWVNLEDVQTDRKTSTGGQLDQACDDRAAET
jgi:hypothetical protein